MRSNTVYVLLYMARCTSHKYVHVLFRVSTHDADAISSIYYVYNT